MRQNSRDAGDMMLIIQSKDGGDEAFLTLPADEIHAMTYAEEGTPKTSRLSSLHALKMVVSIDTRAEHVFASVKEDNPIGVRMTSTVCT